MRVAGRGQLGAGLGLVLATANTVLAHDLWIEPSAFAPQPGERVAIHLRVGERFEGDPVPRDGAGIARLAVLAPAGERPLPGVEGVDPAGILISAELGANWVVYESRPRPLALDAARFESYLREEGLEAVIARRAARGESGQPGRELYQRCAKALLVAGEPSAEGWRRAAGCELELLLDSPPVQATAGGAVSLRLRFRGAGVAGLLVSASSRGRPSEVLTARTDLRGRVSFAVDNRPDVWLFRTVHMEPLADVAVAADWRSWWASLTVLLGDR